MPPPHFGPPIFPPPHLRETVKEGAQGDGLKRSSSRERLHKILTSKGASNSSRALPPFPLPPRSKALAPKPNAEEEPFAIPFDEVSQKVKDNYAKVSPLRCDNDLTGLRDLLIMSSKLRKLIDSGGNYDAHYLEAYNAAQDKLTTNLKETMHHKMMRDLNNWRWGFSSLIKLLQRQLWSAVAGLNTPNNEPNVVNCLHCKRCDHTTKLCPILADTLCEDCFTLGHKKDDCRNYIVHVHELDL